MPAPKVTEPFLGEIAEAKRHPNGWVYRIAGQFHADERVPAGAILGAWRVDAEGNIIGSFVPNENYDAEKWPS
jgi:hypothetical protein